MAFEEITKIASSYRRASRSSLNELRDMYSRRDEREALELAAIAADVAIDDLINLGLEPDENPLLREAFEIAYPNPNLSIDSLQDSGSEYAEKLVNGLKGKYFEILVLNRLNDGGSVGGLTLGEGETAVLAQLANQQGWDIQILDGSGEPVELLQVKASESLGYIKQALETNPNIRVVVPEGVGETIPNTLQMEGVSNSELTNDAGRQLQEWSESNEWSESDLLNAVHHGAEFALDAVPIVSIGLTAVLEGQRVLTGRSTLNEAAKRGGLRIAEASAWTSAGAALTHIGVGEPISAAVITGARMYAGRVSKYRQLADTIEFRTAEIKRLLPEN